MFQMQPQIIKYDCGRSPNLGLGWHKGSRMFQTHCKACFDHSLNQGGWVGMSKCRCASHPDSLQMHFIIACSTPVLARGACIGLTPVRIAPYD